MNRVVVAPCAKKLKAIVFNTVPHISSEGCRPYFEVTNNIDDEIIYSSKLDGRSEVKQYSVLDPVVHFEFEEEQEPVLFGDVHFLFKNKGVISDSLICRIAFNTAFIPHNNNLTFLKTTVSPDKVKKDSRIHEEFLV